MSEEFARIRIEGEGISGQGYRVFLDDKDISNYVYTLQVNMDTDDPNRVTLGLIVSELEFDVEVLKTHLDIEGNYIGKTNLEGDLVKHMRERNGIE